MFNRAALLSIQLYAMGQVFAEIPLNESRSKEVSRGGSVILTCNISRTNLNISKVQHDDAGLYRCNVADLRSGTGTIVWNLTVSGEPEEVDPSWFYLYTLSAVGLLLVLCVFTSAVCLYRKLRARTPNQIAVEGQMDIQSEGEGVTGSRTNINRRSQYMERVNYIYDL
ncbi:hypothetical protein OYC64_018962 [Pagothenia borchgrevinki]|uniref:Immunoglobulin domain-containing protein n=1 Tax=Pagothenia borchgrevinki TaxID=8213 RepID=A0ABD2GRM2_PAGBO